MFDVDKEIWKDIPEYEGLYEASSHGRVRSANGKATYKKHRNGSGELVKRVWKSRILKEKNPNKKGRSDKRVDLWKDGKPKTMLVSRIVAMTFIDNSDNLPTINHIDGDHRNNHISNLEWSSYEENNNHAFDNGLIKTQKKVILASDGEEIEFDGMSKGSRFLGRNNGYLSDLINRGSKIATSSCGKKYEVILDS